MDWWTVALLALYLALAVVLWRSGRWTQFPAFTVLAIWSAAACLPWLLNSRDWKWFCQMATIPIRAWACWEAFRAVTLHIEWRISKHVLAAGVLIGILLAIPFLGTPPQRGLEGWTLVLFRIKDLANLGLGCWLATAMAGIWTQNLKLSSWWARSAAPHAVLLAALCLSIPLADVFGVQTRREWQIVFAVRSIFQYLLLACWIWINRRQRRAKYAASGAA